MNKKVIGEFICDEVYWLKDRVYNGKFHYRKDIIIKNACLSNEEFLNYGGNFAWHISDLKIYDKLKELNEFYTADFEEAYSNWEDVHSIGVSGCGCVQYSPKPKEEDYQLKKAPQNWCYVEER